MTIRKVALVTGAARGMGAATVAALAADQWHVVAIDRCRDDPALAYPMGTREELDAAVEAAGGSDRVVAVEADVRDAAALQKIVADATTRWGGVDVAVAAAGVIAGGVPGWELDPASERAVLEVNLGGVMALARAAVPAMLARTAPRAGRFIAIASAAATRGLPMLAAYSAAKAGVVGFVEALALELRGSGVTANAVNPGSTSTPILDESARLYGLEGRESFARQQPIERLISPDEIAAAVLFLVGPTGSAITGSALAIDGGLVL